VKRALRTYEEGIIIAFDLFVCLGTYPHNRYEDIASRCHGHKGLCSSKRTRKSKLKMQLERFLRPNVLRSTKLPLTTSWILRGLFIEDLEKIGTSYLSLKPPNPLTRCHRLQLQIWWMRKPMNDALKFKIKHFFKELF